MEVDMPSARTAPECNLLQAKFVMKKNISYL